jgi:hypothetical protein
VKISGFTIARQAVLFDYPLEECLRSLLPLVDELVVGVGDADDGTWELVQRIGDPKIQAFRSTWDLTRRHGETLSEETNKALARCSGDWAVYLQADEVLQERELPQLRAALERYRYTRVEALSFRYHHFYGSYATIQDHPLWFYRRATRAVKTGIGARSIGDACAFGALDGGRWRRLRRANIDVHVFHYGWVRPPAAMVRKQRNLELFFEGESSTPGDLPDEAAIARRIYGRLGHLQFFRGTHPVVMQARIARQSWRFEHHIEEQWPDWVRHCQVYLRWPVRNTVRRALRRVREGLRTAARRSELHRGPRVTGAPSRRRDP